MMDKLILGILLRQDMTGYDIKKFIDERFGIFYKASYGNIYPTLKHLAKKDNVQCFEDSKGGRQKNYYHITDNGKQKFMEWLENPIDIADGPSINLVKLHFYDYLPESFRKCQLSKFISSASEYLKRLKEVEQQRHNLGYKEDCYYELSTLYYGILITSKQIEWYKHIYNKEPLETLLTT